MRQVDAKKHGEDNLPLIFIAGMCVFRLSAGPIAEGSDKFLGNVCNGTPVPAFADYWNQITLENHGKWGLVQPTNRNEFNWAAVDSAYAYCKNKGWPYKHHCFVWGQQQPRWINDLSADEQKEAVVNYIRKFGERYPETDFIDVVNEPINAPPAYREALGGSGETGWDWVVTVFALARQYCPGARLLINEYDIENNPAKALQYREIVAILQSKHLIDGIGIQSHCFNLENTPVATIRFCLDTLASTGLPLYSSEFDLTGDEFTQLERYKTYFPIFWEHPAVKGVTLWGWTSNWKGAIIMSGGREYAALTWLRRYVDSLEQSSACVRQPPRPSCHASFPLIVTRFGHTTIQTGLTGVAPVSLRIAGPTGKTVFVSRESPVDGSISLPTGALGKGLYVITIRREDTQMVTPVIVR